MLNIKKIIAFMALIYLTLGTGCGSTAATFNNLESINEGAARYIEGSYTEEMSADAFETLTGLNVRQSLPPSLQSETHAFCASYDKDGGIINIQGGIGVWDNGCAAGIDVYSTELWSNLSYSSVEYIYGSDETNELLSTTIDHTSVLFFHYDDSKEKEYKLGYDVYIAEFELNEIYVYVESNTMGQDDFEQFVTSLIETTEKGEQTQ